MYTSKHLAVGHLRTAYAQTNFLSILNISFAFHSDESVFASEAKEEKGTIDGGEANSAVLLREGAFAKAQICKYLEINDGKLNEIIGTVFTHFAYMQ